MKKVKNILIIAIIILVILLGTIAYRTNITNNIMEKSAATKSEFSIETKNDNTVLVKFYNPIGIQEIKYPNGDIIYCEGKTDVGIDWKVSKNKKYEFIMKDTNDVEKTHTFYTPEIHTELTRNDININLENAKNVIKNNLNNSLIATNFITVNVVATQRELINSTTTDMQTVFNTWKRFGSGNWTYNKKNDVVTNSANVDWLSGYYSPNSNYTDITFSFEAKSTGDDDDLIGCMARANEDSYANNISAYLFTLDAGGKGNVSLFSNFNGILKGHEIEKIYGIHTSPGGNNMGSYTQMLHKVGTKYSKNTWQSWKMKIKGNKIEGYLNGSLIAQAYDDSYIQGAYGFVTLSQSASYRNIQVEAERTLSLPEIISSVNYTNGKINILVNFNNKKETSLSTQECVNSFNSKNIHYIQVTSSANAGEINTFLGKIGNRGRYVESSNYDNYMKQINDYIVSYTTKTIL